jgi:hypothetical protein
MLKETTFVISQNISKPILSLWKHFVSINLKLSLLKSDPAKKAYLTFSSSHPFIFNI